MQPLSLRLAEFTILVVATRSSGKEIRELLKFIIATTPCTCIWCRDKRYLSRKYVDKVMEAVGILWGAATCLFGCGIVHAAYVYKLKENLESLKRKSNELHNRHEDVLTKIQDLESMGEMRRKNEVNGWFEDVARLQEEMETIQAKGSQEILNRCLNGCFPKNCVSSYKLGKKVVKMLREVDDLLTHANRFDNNDNIAHKLPPKPVDEMPSVETVGQDLMVDKVWSNLEDQSVGIIGLYGMGGAGKTTLTKRIHNEFRKRVHNFDLVFFVVVSKEVDINKIVDDIRKRLGVTEDSWNKCSNDQRVAKIYQLLKQKKFVLMLDDLWGNLELQEVGIPLHKDTNVPSKVLFTTRMKDVCAKMQADRTLKVECLSKREALDLFCKKVGPETINHHMKIAEIARDMAEECKGLPLALITVGSAMAGVNDVDSWREAKSDLTNSPWTASDMEKKVFSIIKFSYDRLPDETHKSCFLYCALYPEDYEIKVDHLVDRWIAEGLVGKDKRRRSIYSIYEQGKSILTKLKLSCLLEDVAEGGFPREKPAVKMHDVIRDMAIWISCDEDRKKEKVVVGRETLSMSEWDSERLNDVERISMINYAEPNWKIPSCPNLLTLHVCIRLIDFSNLQCMKKLKILDLSGWGREMKRSDLIQISKLRNLEFLKMGGFHIRERLPIELKNLKKLKVFIMESINFFNNINMFPVEVIESLEQLKVFRFHAGYYSFVSAEILEKLEWLPELEELCITLTTESGMNKLLGSIKLWDCLRSLFLIGIEEVVEMTSLLESFSRMKYLELISLWKMSDLMDSLSITHIYHFHNLRQVSITDCQSITHLTWIKYAPLLESIEVWGCESIEEVVKGGEDENIERDNSMHIFLNLRYLRLGYLSKVKSIHKRALSFPSLECILIAKCPNLRKLPLNSNSAKDTLSEIQGQHEWWDNLEWEEPSIKDLLYSKFKVY